LGIELSRARTVSTNEYLQTLYPNIYACGDVAGPYQFTHTASHQAGYAALNALFGGVKRFRADYSVIPWATFTDPEVARVGLNETEAKEKNVAYDVTQYLLEDPDLAIAAPRGRSSQMNAGAAIARGEVLLFLHADTRLPQDADARILQGLAASGRAWGRFDVRIEGASLCLPAIAFFMNLRSSATG